MHLPIKKIIIQLRNRTHAHTHTSLALFIIELYSMSSIDASSVEFEEKWDHSLENLLRKSTVGLAVGVLPALVLARTFAARCSLLCFSVGVGSGMAYREARYLFDKNVAFDNRYLVQMRLPVQSG